MIRLAYTWECQNCAEHGTGPKSDLEARKHTEGTGHATRTHARPA